MSSPDLPTQAPDPEAPNQPPPVESSPAPMGHFDRLFGALFDPKPAFADIAARPKGWWVPLILLTLFSISTYVAIDHRIGWDRVIIDQIESDPRAQEQLQQIPAERREVAIQQQVEILSVVIGVVSVVIWPIMALVLAGMFLFVFNVLAGQEVRFIQSFGITTHALLPMTLQYAVTWSLLWLKEPGDINMQNPVASNLGIFLDPSSVPAWLVSLGNSLDIFIGWVLLLLATGFAAAGRRLSWGQALGWILAAWSLYLIVKVGWVWIFG